MNNTKLNTIYASFLDFVLCFFTRFITGISPKFTNEFPFNPYNKVYYSNHNSHADFILVWVSLPKELRVNVHPVASSDYWLKSKFKSFIVKDVFKSLLIDRNEENPQKTIDMMSSILKKNESLIIFPEGTRNIDDDVKLQPFKTGLYYLAKDNPNTDFIPIWLNNINHVLPKGKFLPVPLLCDVIIGEPIKLAHNDTKDSFLQKAQQHLLALSPVEELQ